MADVASSIASASFVLPVAHEKSLRLGGRELCYSVRGSGPAVLMIQGVGVIGRGWQPQVDALCPRFTTITFDNRGLGRSALGADPLTIEGMAADAVAIADAEHLDRFHLVGHSMGGLIALHIALSARRRVKSLALMCTFADGKDGSRLSPSMILSGLRTRVGTQSMRRNAMMRLIMPDAYLRTVDREPLAERLAELFGRDLADHPPIVMTQLRAMSAYSAVGRLSELTGMPALVLSAAHDPIARPALGKAIAAGIGSARLVEFAEAGHALPIQCAAEVNRLLLEHLAVAEQSAIRKDPDSVSRNCRASGASEPGERSGAAGSPGASQ